jgi:hypothetical protein
VVWEQRADIPDGHLPVVSPIVPRQQQPAEAGEGWVIQHIADPVANLQMPRGGVAGVHVRLLSRYGGRQ